VKSPFFRNADRPSLSSWKHDGQRETRLAGHRDRARDGRAEDNTLLKRE
jgi:hypothetical protein